jgi:hypothetical protein
MTCRASRRYMADPYSEMYMDSSAADCIEPLQAKSLSNAELQSKRSGGAMRRVLHPSTPHPSTQKHPSTYLATEPLELLCSQLACVPANLLEGGLRIAGREGGKQSTGMQSGAWQGRILELPRVHASTVPCRHLRL